MCKSGSHVVNDELSYVDEKFTIGFNENNFKERTSIERFLSGKEQPTAEEIQGFIPQLLDEFTARIGVDELLYYGWTSYDVASALADNLEPDELLEAANKTCENWKFRDYLQDGMYKYHVLDLMRGKKIGEVEDVDAADAVLTELKEHFENSSWSEGFEDEAFDEWYDEFSEYTLKPILMGDYYLDVDKEIDEMTLDETLNALESDTKAIDYESAVKESVHAEFLSFQEKTLQQSTEYVFQKNYEIHVKTELLEISIPSDLRITAKDKDGDVIEITPYQVHLFMDNTQSAEYVKQKARTEYEESKMQAQEKSEMQDGNESGWRYVFVPETAKIAEYDDSTLFRMPTNGAYKGYAYFIPKKLLKENDKENTIRIALPDGFIVKAKNNRAEKEEERKVEFKAEDFVELIKGTGAADYETYRKPSDEKEADAFSETEARLIESVPQEMKDRPNWVAIKTWYNVKKDKIEKRPIDCNTGEYADSVNPTTWTTFDKARVYAKENGYTTIAYALNGKDGICCIDLDGCLDENGNYSALANQVLRKSGKTYTELSVSGKGLHIFGKTKGMEVRSFSKDGDMEFYQEGRFISMTGNGAGYYSLESFDTPEMKELILRKCEKRGEWNGQGQGVRGLSAMTDRDVVEKACADKKHGATFKALYEGQNLRNNHSNSDMSLMNRLAFWCNGDKEQMLRIFATSGLYRPEKSDGYYEGTAIKAVKDVTSRYNAQQNTPTRPTRVNDSGKGGK